MRRMRLIFFVLLLPVVAQGQQPFNDDYFLFESSDAVRINAMIQDTVGYMWLGTEIGLYRFNGQGDLTPIYDTVHSPVTALFDAGGQVYAGYHNGALARVSNDSISVIPVIQRPHGAVRTISVSESGLIFFGGDLGLFCTINNSTVNVGQLCGISGGACYSIAVLSDTAMMVAMSSGVYRISIS